MGTTLKFLITLRFLLTWRCAVCPVAPVPNKLELPYEDAAANLDGLLHDFGDLTPNYYQELATDPLLASGSKDYDTIHSEYGESSGAGGSGARPARTYMEALQGMSRDCYLNIEASA